MARASSQSLDIWSKALLLEARTELTVADTYLSESRAPNGRFLYPVTAREFPARGTFALELWQPGSDNDKKPDLMKRARTLVPLFKNCCRPRLQKLSHRVVKLYGSGLISTYPASLASEYWITTELCAGGTLRDALHKIVLTPRLIQKWARQVLEGILYLSFQIDVQRSLNNRFKAGPFMVPVSAENVMLTSANANASNVKIDFGDFLKHPLADEIRTIDPRKVLHMAPEMLEIENYIPRHRSRSGAAIDLDWMNPADVQVWSFGILFLEIMAGDMLRLPMKEDELDRLRTTCDDETYKKKIVEYIMDASRVAHAFSRTASFPIAELLIDSLDSDAQVRSLQLEDYSIFSVKPAELQWNTGKIDAKYTELRELRTGGRANMVIMRRSVGGFDEEILVKTVQLPQVELLRNGAVLSMRRKALVLLDLSHPNVVRHFDFQFALDKTPEYKCYMEYCAGGSLDNAVEGKPPSPERFKGWARQILLGIEYLHQRKVVHHDMKCANVFLTSADWDSCVLKIGDLDDMAYFAKFNVDQRTTASTPSHAALEVLEECVTWSGEDGEYTDTPKRDIWSFGCILVHMLTGQPPTYHAEEVEEDHAEEVKEDSLSSRDVHGNIQSSFISRVREMGMPILPTGTPKDVAKIIKKCFVKDTLVRLSASQLLARSFFADRSRSSLPGTVTPDDGSNSSDSTSDDPYSEAAFRDFKYL